MYDVHVCCSVPEECPQEIADLIEQCCQPEPHLRPDAAQCAAVISEFLPPGYRTGISRAASSRTSGAFHS